MNFHDKGTREKMEKDGWTYEKDGGGEWFQKQIGYLRVSVTAKSRVHTLDKYNGYMTTEYYDSFLEAMRAGQWIIEDEIDEQ